MKYTLEGLDQEKLLEYKLDIADALFIRWFIDFSGINEKNTENPVMKHIQRNGVLYYLVNYAALIEEFPILGITTTKGISKHFEKFVELGLMDRISVQTQKGRVTYYSKNEALLNLTYERQKEIREGKKQIHENIPQENSSSFAEKNTIQNIPQENSSSFANENTIQNIPQENSSSFANETTIQNIPQENSSSFANEINCSEYSAKELQFRRKGTPVPSQENSSSFALNNPSTINSSIINSSSAEAYSAEAKIIITKLFENTLFSFPDKLFSEIGSSFSEMNVAHSELGAYLRFVYNESVNAKPKNLGKYFYSLVSKKFEICKFLKNDKNENKKNIITKSKKCPCCGNEVNINASYCGICNLPSPFSPDLEEIRFYKFRFQLPEETKKNLDSELSNLSVFNGNQITPSSIQSYIIAKEKILKKYNFS